MTGRIERTRSPLDIVRLFVVSIAIAVIVLIPLRVIGYGFLPLDDLLRHVAKAVSGRDWSDILILRPGIVMDSHPGFHAALGFLHRVTGWPPDAMVCFSVSILFVAFCVVAVTLIDRPEAWLAALLAVSLTNFSFIMRLLSGRPFIITMAVIVAVLLLWPRLKDNSRLYRTAGIITVLLALSTWMHSSWYLLVLPVACFLLAREWRIALIVGICTALGVLCGAVLTGHPLLFLKHNIILAVLAFNNHALPRTLAVEFRPFTGDLLSAFVVVLMLVWRQARGEREAAPAGNPAFMLLLIGWVLGFYVQRFWLDIGLSALLVWVAQELDGVFKKAVAATSWKRTLFVVPIAGALFLNITNDIDDRWSRNPAVEYLHMHRLDGSWMPGRDGIVYSDDMRAFYVTFFAYPRAPWRYLVGFEPGLMPEKDLAVFLNVQMAHGSADSFYPWVRKMRSADRLIITPESGREPDIPELEWRYGGSGLWVGRLRSSGGDGK